ncbi:MAG: LL-diaminopimelate aminotransferase [Armatimonadota bacterium]|nr:LL-diaminopimelate aminotransferase [Armatimonadota bacterium]MDR7438365.1 LL-diaminopimelate aminotransferase [Armatimonadota bacterium]MDR7563369.1 LL-diaminopimelate aminotransferase [Armatimonadota bacterium]MDR7567443.1 LL-diaminopimelate aminotransferase [Armatimonadota bacterium]MDR7601672.1 LL-diaminopimelate aminotransferase [Armatimonadota bacterium]
MPESQRLQRIPPYLFAELDRRKEELERKGVEVVSLAVGDPDLPTPEHIVRALQEAVKDPATHPYPPYAGTRGFREAVAGWYTRRFGVPLDPDREVLALIGSKEGIAHLPWALINPGDAVLVPDPGYPVYGAATLLADGEVYPLRLRADRGWLPDLESVPQEVARRTRLLFLNYPNNPTGATAEVEVFEEVVRFAREYGIVVAHDNSYSEIAYDGYRPPSFLQASGAREVGVEFHSLSKTFCMTGWRLGFVCGNAEVIAALAKLKTNLDSGVFVAIQRAGEAALRGPEEPIRERVRVYQARRDLAVAALQEAGWRLVKPQATFYLWAQVPEGFRSVDFAARVLEQTGVLLTPGIGYGEGGEGYVRLSLTVPDHRLREALRRLQRMG